MIPWLLLGLTTAAGVIIIVHLKVRLSDRAAYRCTVSDEIAP